MRRLSNETADVPGVLDSNRKLNVSLNRTLLCHTTNLYAFVLTPAVRICGFRALKERKYELPVAICDGLRRQLSRCLRSLSPFQVRVIPFAALLS